MSEDESFPTASDRARLNPIYLIPKPVLGSSHSESFLPRWVLQVCFASAALPHRFQSLLFTIYALYRITPPRHTHTHSLDKITRDEAPRNQHSDLYKDQSFFAESLINTSDVQPLSLILQRQFLMVLINCKNPVVNNV